ncbi:hypothetical protein B0H13DRAFT_720331 [Mycena leptocephala]|nr:hypothetical protein B0H13DRAFT_720331 [Mycena leptocephala]
MTVKSIENYDEFKEVISSETLVIIYFGAARCRHCTVASPVFEELSKKPEYDGKHKFYEINTDLVESKKATNNAEIQKIPSFLLFRSGEQVTSTNKAGELDTLIKNHTTTAASMTSAPAEANAVDLELDARIKDHTTTAALAQAALSKGEINSDPENNALVLQLDTLIKILDRIAPTPPVADAPSVADPAPPYTCSLPIKYLPPEDPNDIEKNQIKSLHHYLAMIKEKQQTIIVFADGGRIRSTNKELKEDNKYPIFNSVRKLYTEPDCGKVEQTEDDQFILCCGRLCPRR